MTSEQTDESSGPPAAWTVRPTSSRASPQQAPLATVFTEGRMHRVRHANAAFCLLVDQDGSKIVNRPLDAVLGADGRAALRGLLDRVYATGMPNVLSDLAWKQRASGAALRYVTAIASPVRNESTGAEGLLVQVLETTEQVVARMSEERIARDARLANEALVLAGLREHGIAEAALRERERWNALVENLAEGITVLDRDGQAILVNPVGRMLLDLQRESSQAYSECAFYTVAGGPVPPELHPALRALAGERFTDEELVFRREDRSSRHLLFSGTSVRDEAGEVVLAVNAYRDVTALRQLEATKEEYVALISHDLRNPLYSLLLNSQLLVARFEASGRELPVIEARCVHSIAKMTRRLAAMVDELYESSRLESGRLDMVMEPAAPASLIAELLEELGTADASERLSVVERASDLPTIHVNIPRIQRALVNLITNALKYSEAGSKVVVELDRTSTEVVFAVRDGGPGISEDDLRHIFDKYHRSRTTCSRDGMGLGLYITKRIVEAHGGCVTVESAIGRGSTFRVALPIAGRGWDTRSSGASTSP